jgi:hypothetical protein
MIKPTVDRVPCTTVYPTVTTHFADGHEETRVNVACPGTLSICSICGQRSFCSREHHCLNSAGAGHVRAARFEIDTCQYGYPEGVPGYTRGERWNGWQCPYFEKPAAMVVISYLLQDENTVAYFDPDRDAFIVNTYCERGARDPEYDEVFAAEVMDTPDGTKTVYPIGAFSWCWDEVPTEEVAE